MQQSMRVAAIQMVSGYSVADNLAQAERWIGKAADEGAQLIALPEFFCFLGRRGTDKLAISEAPDSGPIQDFLARQALERKIWLVGGTVPLRSPDAGRIYNACLVFDPQGQRKARYDKIHLFDYHRNDESYKESRTIRPGDNVPQVFDSPIGRTALAVCYDLRFPEFFRAQGDVRLMVIPASFTYTTGSVHWEVLLRARAIENQCYVLASAQGGVHANGRRTWGHSMLIDPWGEVLNCLDEGPGVVSGVVDVARLQALRASLPALTHRVM